MKHEEMIKTNAEYRRTYNLMKDHELSIEQIIEVVVKSNGMVGVGVVSFKQAIDAQLDKLMKGY